jgi:hypothetical protein
MQTVEKPVEGRTTGRKIWGKKPRRGVFPLKSNQILNFFESSKFASAWQKDFLTR